VYLSHLKVVKRFIVRLNPPNFLSIGPGVIPTARAFHRGRRDLSWHGPLAGGDTGCPLIFEGWGDVGIGNLILSFRPQGGICFSNDTFNRGRPSSPRRTGDFGPCHSVRSRAAASERSPRRKPKKIPSIVIPSVVEGPAVRFRRVRKKNAQSGRIRSGRLRADR
jgi:hypothetical protein